MTNRKRAFWATTALCSGLLIAGAASAQSSGTAATEATDLGTVVVTGARGPRTTDGTLVVETVSKTRSTITQEYITTQSPGQTILQSLNLVPGLNFVNADPYGNSGGNIRLRGFDGNRVSLTFDGVPLNDTGNYAVFTNQQLDPELIQKASVNQGTTDVDSPTASATGGTINYTSARPLQTPGLETNYSLGDFNFTRVFLRADSGAFGPWGTTGYLTASYTNYDKFKGRGSLEKQQYNGRLYQDLGDGDFAGLSFNWNQNRNNFYNNFITLAQFQAGTALENDNACLRPTPVNGTVQNENSGSTRTLSNGTTATGSCTNFYGLRINPSNTGNIRGQFSYGLTDKLRFTFDPSFQYVIANGGGFTVVSEKDNRLDQNLTQTTGVGVDLNGDGDTLDSVGLYTPSNTNTQRYGILSSLIYDLNDNNRIRLAYTLDYGRHRQSGDATRFTQDSYPLNVFGGQRGWGSAQDRVLGRDGSNYRSRDRLSHAILNQFSIEYRGNFLDDALTVTIGARAPFFKRELNQYCFSLNGSSTVRCTTEAPATTNADGDVTFSGVTGTFINPYATTLKYDAILPNLGVTWRFAEGSSIYGSYAEGLSAPRTDNLYQPVRNTTTHALDFSGVAPETTKSYDLGYRFSNDRIIASIAGWYTEYQNRIVSSLDNDPASPFFGQFIDRNVGAVKQKGVDAQIGFELTDAVTLYASASYNDSEIQDNLFIGNFNCTNLNQVAGSTPACPTAPTPALPIAQFLQTAGKKLVETPDWTYSARIDWKVTPELNLGLQAKYVSDRFSTDVNDEIFPAYTVADFDARYDMTRLLGVRGAYLQVNVTNLFDEQYLGNISTGNNALASVVSTDGRVPLRSGVTRTGSQGSPRTAVVSLGLKF